ncbi:hypothetical protein [Sutterella wadsworthensis]|uniref:hypothetical protein n=1 Tax=Sutterella wadsworthensis TaxID=40545 RepID=UPI00307DBF3A
MISLLCKRAQSLLARVLREESGSAAVNVVFFLIGGIALTAFVVDATRVSADGARLKQATDAAAQAVAMEAAKDSETDVLGMAQRYVAVNLGLDKEQLSRDLSVAVEPVTWNDYEGYRVSASFRALPSLLGGPGKTVEVASAAVAIYNPLEIALVVPSTINETQRDMQAIRDIGEAFYDEVIDGRADRCRIELSRSGSAISNRGRVSLIWPLPICPMSARRFFMFVGECAAGNSSIGLNRREDLLKSALKPVTAATALCRTIPAGGPISLGGGR